MYNVATVMAAAQIIIKLALSSGFMLALKEKLAS